MEDIQDPWLDSTSWPYRRRSVRSRFYPQILQASKFFYDEGMKMLYGRNIFVFVKLNLRSGEERALTKFLNEQHTIDFSRPGTKTCRGALIRHMVVRRADDSSHNDLFGGSVPDRSHRFNCLSMIIDLLKKHNCALHTLDLYFDTRASDAVNYLGDLLSSSHPLYKTPEAWTQIGVLRVRGIKSEEEDFRLLRPSGAPAARVLINWLEMERISYQHLRLLGESKRKSKMVKLITHPFLPFPYTYVDDQTTDWYLKDFNSSECENEEGDDSDDGGNVQEFLEEKDANS